MDFERLFALSETVRAGQKLTAREIAFVRRDIPSSLDQFPKFERPRSIRHPAGFTISGAPVGTLVRSALLLVGQRVFGTRYAGSDFYQRVEADLAMRIMRSHFNGMAPKGAFCCKPCTLAVLTVLDARAIHYFDCAPLARAVRRMISAREWRFATAPNEYMLRWAVGPAGLKKPSRTKKSNRAVSDT